MSKGDRKMTSTCRECGASNSITSSKLGPLEMMAALDRAHDELNPDCPQRLADPGGAE